MFGWRKSRAAGVGNIFAVYDSVGRRLPASMLALPPACSASCAVGVGHIRAATASIKLLPSLLRRGVTRAPLVPNDATGVGHIRAAVARPRPAFADAPGRLLLPVTVGVGHGSCLAIAPSVGRSVAPGLSERLNMLPLSTVHGVGYTAPGDDPDPLTKMRCPTVGRGKHIPSRIEPERGQVAENDSESPRSERWAVLHSHPLGFHFANHAGELSPEPRALAIESGAATGNADVLARESARNAVSNASPRASVKAEHVIPYRERR